MSLAENFFRFATERHELIGSLEGARVRYAWLNTAGAQTKHSFNMNNTSDEELERLKTEVDAWFQESGEAAKSTLAGLKESAQTLTQEGIAAADVSVESVEDLLDTVTKAAQEWQKRTQDEQKRRKDKASAVEKFIQDDAKLLQWCRQERSNFEAQREPAHQQEFCHSLLMNCGTVEENLKVIWQMGTPLLPDREVEKALVEINEVWLYLQLFAFEQHQRLMYEIHPTAKLEDEVRTFADFTTRLEAYLDTVGERAEEDLVRQCKDLKRDLQEHANLPQQLKDFATRMEAIRANYKAFRQHVLAKLTFITDDDSRPEDRAAARQLEYAEKTAEIRAWGNSQGGESAETWKGLHEKVTGLRELVAQQLAALTATADPSPQQDEGDEQF
eukprot:Hpha_TRINITY_DN15396_c6_g2::TRINITY_DN15396_c6_g2_i2::g.88909::m.88909